MLIVVNAMFPMFSFCKLLYLYMFRCGAREAVRGVSCFPADRADLHRCRSGKANPTDRAQARQMPQMPFGVLLVFPQIAQICTDAVRGASCFPQIASMQMPFGCFLFSTQIAPLAPRCKREFCYNVTCYMLQ